MTAKILMGISCCIISLLGFAHLVFTYWGPKLTPADPKLQVSMGQISPVITRETTMWQCWIGFNTTHSMCLILFGLIYAYLALAHDEILFRSPFLLIIGIVTLGSLLILSKAYFFSRPFGGVGIALICFIAAIVASRF